LKPARTLTLALLLASLVPAVAQPLKVERIVWLSADPPPAADSKSGTALAERLVAFMRRQWPGVEHVIVRANAQRAWQLLASGEPACHASAVHTAEREKIAHFTDTLVGPPLQLIVRREKLTALPRNGAGEIELQRLLADPLLRGALIHGRSYGPVIDGLLARRPDNPSVLLYSASDYGSKLLPMLAVGRADYAIEYDIALGVMRENMPGAAALTSQPIAGVSEPMRAGVACPRTPWGHAAITHIDTVLGSPAGAAMLRESTERLMTPELRQRHAARLDAFYRERAKPSVIR